MGNIAGKRRVNYSWHTVSVDSVLSTKFAKEYTHLKENIMWIKKKNKRPLIHIAHLHLEKKIFN